MTALDRTKFRPEVAGRTVKFKSKLSYVTVTMRHSHISLNHQLRLPTEFSKNIIVKRGKLILKEGAQTWDTSYHVERSRNNSRIAISAGWRDFVREKNLKIGDVCAFELLPATNCVTLQVTILRNSEGVRVKSIPHRKRKRNIVETGATSITRQRAVINNTSTPKAGPQSPRPSLASPLLTRKNANTFPREAKRIRGRKVNEEQENVLILSDESDNESTANELCGEANLPEELVGRCNDPSLQAYSDKDSQSLSESSSDFEAGLITYARRPAKVQSNSRAGNTSNSRIIDDVQRNLEIPFSAFLGDVSAQNFPRNSGGNGIGMMPREDPSTCIAVERPIEAACNLTRTCSFGFTEMITMNDLECRMVEVQSPAVGTVHVKEKFVPILRRIIEKYGDILVNYKMESIPMRSSSLEAICQIIQILQAKSFDELPLSEITSLLAHVHDFRKIGMRVEWLEKRLEDIEAAKHADKELFSLKEEKENDKNIELLKELQRKLEDDRTQLNDCRTQISILNDSINEQMKKLEVYEVMSQELLENEKSIMKDLKKARDDGRRLKQTLSDSIHKVQRFVAYPVVHDLL